VFSAPQGEAVVEWLKLHISERGQHMPHVDEIHLPPGTWTDLYDLCIGDLQDQHRVYDAEYNEKLSFGYFLTLLRKNYPTVRIPKEQRFTKCKVCTDFRNDLARTLDLTVIREIKRRKHEHNKKARQERRKYWGRRGKAKRYPEAYLSIIIDGMDQQKTELPRLTVQTQGDSHATRLRVHVTGVLVHGVASFVYLNTERVPKDSNLTIECLMRTLLQLPKPLPPTLFLQADNCSGENKNQFLLAFLAMCVKRNMFNKVQKLNLRIDFSFKFFLPVGHTYPDVLSFFCCSPQQKY
jgi:hypothetical protein